MVSKSFHCGFCTMHANAMQVEQNLISPFPNGFACLPLSVLLFSLFRIMDSIIHLMNFVGCGVGRKMNLFVVLMIVFWSLNTTNSVRYSLWFTRSRGTACLLFCLLCFNVCIVCINLWYCRISKYL